MVLYHSETVTYIVVTLIVQYQHELYSCVYPSHIEIKISKVIIMPKDTEYPMVSGRNEFFVSTSLLYFHDVNGKESKQDDTGTNI